MNGTIDKAHQSPATPTYLGKSVKLAGVYLILFLVSLASIIVTSVSPRFAPVAGIIAVFGTVILLALSPLGIYYSWKSKRNNEDFRTRRIGHAILHWSLLFIFLFTAAGITMQILSDP